ncbi:unnamed protein product, partial [Oncorhynchus mykiss]
VLSGGRPWLGACQVRVGDVGCVCAGSVPGLEPGGCQLMLILYPLGGSFSDDDLLDVGKDDTYNPDKGKGGHGGGQSAADDNNLDTMAETGTIAGIISAIGLALVGAVTSYVSYQKKKLCFSIQQSLNADLVKTDNPDAVVATEPQVEKRMVSIVIWLKGHKRAL